MHDALPQEKKAINQENVALKKAEGGRARTRSMLRCRFASLDRFTFFVVFTIAFERFGVPRKCQAPSGDFGCPVWVLRSYAAAGECVTQR